MSELINTSDNRIAIRWKLLTGASVLALTVSSIAAAHAEDADRPTIWIDLGGQAERVGDTPQLFAPPFFDNTPASDLAPMVKAQKPSPFSLGLDGKITFSPEGSDWVLSAAVRYGKSSVKRHNHQQTALPYLHQYLGTNIYSQPGVSQFGDGQTDYTESHLVVDFQAGKDVGLGMFGANGSSIISAGVRFANFRANSKVTLNARPLNEVGQSYYFELTHFYESQPSPHYATFKFKNYALFRHTYAASMQAQREVRGVGPAISWNASLPVAGNEKDMTLDFDWGLNAAVLFGRQRTRERHKTSGRYFSRTGGPPFVGAFFSHPIVTHEGALYPPHSPVPQTRTRNVTIPNVGGFAGISLKFTNAKISLGYRADVFFNAMDGGIDTRKDQNRSFYGPFASISIGLGD